MAHHGPHIAKLAISHDPGQFDCGHDELNSFIRLDALQGQRANISQTYVAVTGEVITGYQTLVVGSVTYEDVPDRLAKGIPRYDIPVLLVLLLARLAAEGLGAALASERGQVLCFCQA